VRRDIDLDPPAETLAPLQHRHEIGQHRPITREHGRSTAVVRGDGDTTLFARDELVRFGQRDFRRQHRSLAACPSKQPGSGTDHPRGVFQAQRTRDVRRCRFAQAVPHHRGGLDSPRAPQRGQRDLDGEDCRLDHTDVGGPGIVLPRSEFREQGLPQIRAHRVVARG
jgi:hypothetical protein